MHARKRDRKVEIKLESKVGRHNYVKASKKVSYKPRASNLYGFIRIFTQL